MKVARAFLSGMTSAYELSPTEKEYKAHFVSLSKSRTINLNIDSNINNSWVTIASCQKIAFDEIIHKNNEILANYEFSTTR